MNYPFRHQDIWSQFDEICIEHEIMRAAHDHFDKMRSFKRNKPSSDQRFATLLGESQSGKSTIIRSYIETVIVDEVIARGLFPPTMDRKQIARSQKIALHVTLSPKATVKSFATDLLKACDDPRADKGTKDSLLKRVYDHFSHWGTQLLFIDEIQHLSASLSRMNDGRSVRNCVMESTAVTDEIKTMLINGLVPIVIAGLPIARPNLFHDTQLASRCSREIKFGPTDFGVKSERDDFLAFIGTLGLMLKSTGLFPEETDLVSGKLPACIHEASGGKLGMARNIILVACEKAMEADALHLHRHHFYIAIEEWGIPMGICSSNPFGDDD